MSLKKFMQAIANVQEFILGPKQNGLYPWHNSLDSEHKVLDSKKPKRKYTKRKK